MHVFHYREKHFLLLSLVPVSLLAVTKVLIISTSTYVVYSCNGVIISPRKPLLLLMARLRYQNAI